MPKQVKQETCGRSCAARLRKRPKKPLEERKGQFLNCTVCGTPKWYADAWIRKGIKQPTCSKKCNGVHRGQDWAKHGHKGAAAVTPEGRASAIQKMTGSNNPAWKGGVTYFSKHGNYAQHGQIKYIRCPLEFLAMARKDGYVMEHRLIVAQVLGRCLLRMETVHHLNHNPTDNRLTNLALFASNQDHKLYEAHGTPLPIWQG
jgi:hypothetical protein